MKSKAILFSWLVLTGWYVASRCTLTAEEQLESDVAAQARQLLAESGVQGGLVVHVGCGDGRLAAALRVNDRYVVHGLDRDATKIKQAREAIESLGLYGKVSVEAHTGERLPYADNLVNLLVVEPQRPIAIDEMMRVVCPGGVIMVRKEQGWSMTPKPRPEDIDEWTHFLHGPSNNAVARDAKVGPPQHLQWIGGPRWARGHEVLATISAAVTAGGRIFYIADEGSIASVDLPSKWFLVARDAFNGIVLWKRAIRQWESRHRPFRSGPTHLPRRLVAADETVYVTLGFGQPLVALDAATGQMRQTYADTEGTEEVLVDQKHLHLVVGNPTQQQAADRAVRRGTPIPSVDKSIIVLDAVSGAVLWKKSDAETADLFALTLAVGGGRTFFQNTRRVVCLDSTDGAELWRAKRHASLQRPAWSVPTLVVHDNVVISADRQAAAVIADDSKPQRVEWEVSFQGGKSPPGEMVAYAAATGKKLWSGPCREGYNAPVDVLVADGLLWTGDLVRARDPGITQALDPRTGEVKRQRPNDQVFFKPGMTHHRCYRNRATDRFILMGRSGVELLDVRSGKAAPNHWVRGTCQFGVLPANGLIYVPPHTCACYVKTKLNGFNALAPSSTVAAHDPEPGPQRGPAFDATDELVESPDPRTAWPTYRHDAQRSGATAAFVPHDLQRAWQAEVGGKLSSLVVAGGRVIVARPDTHAVTALDAASGERVWSYGAGGPVDSPPTIHQNLVLFGAADGWLYCLRLDDGELVWRFRAGPVQRRIVIDGSLESAWPIHGSVLVQNGLVYFVAGRSSYLDGGIYVYGLDPTSGQVVYESRVSGRDPQTGEQPKEAVQGFDMPTGLPDVLSGDGQHFFMRDLMFDRQCVQQPQGATHLFSHTGFLDDSWWHRSYWLFAPEFKSGWGGWHRAGNQYPAGRLLVFNDRVIFGFGRSVYPRGNAGQWTTGEYYRLFAANKSLLPPKPQPTPPARRRGRRPYPESQVDYRWSYRPQEEVRAMVLTDKTLFVAGPLGETHRSQEAFEGQQGIRLHAIATEDGRPLASYDLDSLPVFDGMVAVEGKIFLATKDGRVVCFAGKEG